MTSDNGATFFQEVALPSVIQTQIRPISYQNWRIIHGNLFKEGLFALKMDVPFGYCVDDSFAQVHINWSLDVYFRTGHIHPGLGVAVGGNFSIKPNDQYMKSGVDVLVCKYGNRPWGNSERICHRRSRKDAERTGPSTLRHCIAECLTSRKKRQPSGHVLFHRQ